jgi:hypothetical protein
MIVPSASPLSNSRELSVPEAIRSALIEEMKRDERVMLLGMDVGELHSTPLLGYPRSLEYTSFGRLFTRPARPKACSISRQDSHMT